MTTPQELWDSSPDGSAFVTRWNGDDTDDAGNVWVKGRGVENLRGQVSTLDWNSLVALTPVTVHYDQVVWTQR